MCDELNSSKTSGDDATCSQDARMVATAYHEAGHAVMALIIGRSIQKLTIVPGKIQTGGIRLGKCDFDKGRKRSTNDWVEDEVLILLAGMVAEARVTGEFCEDGASQDLRLARRLLDDRAAGGERRRDRLERRLLNKTEHLLSDDCHAAAIEMIARELLEKKTISGRSARHLFKMAQQKN